MTSSALPMTTSTIPSFSHTFDCGASSSHDFTNAASCPADNMSAITTAKQSHHTRRDISPHHFNANSSNTHNFDGDFSRHHYAESFGYTNETSANQRHANSTRLQHDQTHNVSMDYSNNNRVFPSCTSAASTYHPTVSTSYPQCPGDDLLHTNLTTAGFERLSSSVSPRTPVGFSSASMTQDLGSQGTIRMSGDGIGHGAAVASMESPNDVEYSWIDRSKADSGKKDDSGMDGVLQLPQCITPGVNMLSSCKYVDVDLITCVVCTKTNLYFQGHYNVMVVPLVNESCHEDTNKNYYA